MKALQLTGSEAIVHYRIIILWLFILSTSHVKAQIISLKNSSLEGTAGLERAVPPEWSIIEETPDIQPGVYGVSMSASDGDTYVGMVATTYIQEGITQLLSHPLDSGKSYSLSFDLAYTARYSWTITYGGFAIYGSSEFGKREELLWSSGIFTHTDWKQYQAVFTPSKAYNYLIVTAYKQPGDSVKNIAGVLVDHFSDIREVIQLSLSSENSCNGDNGVAVAKVKNTDDEYAYLWSTGDTCSRLIGVKNGVYHVTVRGLKKKTTTYGMVNVQASELSGKVNIHHVSCNGVDDGIIYVATRGGVLPYAYHLNDAATDHADSVFSHLAAGTYKVKVTDAGGCTAVIDNIDLKEPEALVIKSLTLTSESCAGAQDGKLVITAEGGTAPYIYSVPGYINAQSDSVLKKLSPGNYSYSVADRHQCQVIEDFEITKGGRVCAVYVPTAFSPNGDGVNDVFRAAVNDYVTNFSMRVFCRWGQQIFESRNPDNGWDGTFKGVYQDPGAYLYVVTYTDSKGQDMKQHGTLVLVR